VTRGRRLEPDARREQILDGALRLFSERPYAAVSTVELAREVGVARGLINHYFGTKRELYLEVVRHLTTIPSAAVEDLPAGSRAERAGAAVDWFLGAVDRHRGLWLAVGTGASGDPEVDAVLAEADEVAVDRVVVALRGTGGPGGATPLVRARLRSFFGLVRSASREWLVRGALDRAQTRELLVAVLLVVLDEPPDGDTRSSHS
jgi:AcrR family transcriptional regulator